MAEDTVVVTNAEDSVAFSIVEEALRSKEISESDSLFLRTKYQKLFDTIVTSVARERALKKRCKTCINDISAERIMLEKLRIEEAEDIQALKKVEDARNSLQKELELTEQRDTMAKYELSELRKIHEELVTTLQEMRRENSSLVGPVISKLKLEIKDLAEQLQGADDTFEREKAQQDNLLLSVENLELLQKEKETVLMVKQEQLSAAENEPGRLTKWAETVEKAATSMENELRVIHRKIKAFDVELDKQAKRRIEAEKLRKSLLEKLELNRQTIEQREKDVSAVHASLENVKALHRDFLTVKVALQSQKKEIDSEYRHRVDQLSLSNKEYDGIKRLLKNKRSIVDAVREVLGPLESQLKDQEVVIKTFEAERDQRAGEIKVLKDEVHFYRGQFFDLEVIEKEKKLALDEAMADVDELESEVVANLTDNKRQSKLISVLSAQRDIKGRDSARVERKDKEARQHVKIKELVILDLTKRCNEISNRLKEFSALYEVVKNERNKYVNLIQSSTQALAEMREKIRILNNEVEILGNESSAKDVALSKERAAHQQAQNQRDALRQDMNKLLSEYRIKQGTVEQQIQEIEKLNVIINNLEKDMLELKGKYERAVEERNVTGVQLIDRNDELCILYERSNQQQEALKKGEVAIVRKQEELRLLRLQTEELKRQFAVAHKRLPIMDVYRGNVETLEEQINNERKKTDTLSLKLEDPDNFGRWRSLDGEDPDLEQLNARVKVLEDRLDKKREQLLEKELVLEEVTAVTDRLRNQVVSKRDSAKVLADQLNELQSRVRDTTKKMLASVSELSMYQATALRLQQEKIFREKALDEAKWRLDHGEAPSEEAIKDWNRSERKRIQYMETSIRRENEMQLMQPLNMTKTAAEPRPTAYIPDEFGIPKPYGGAAPFKPSEIGATMRHIRVPQPQSIEI